MQRINLFLMIVCLTAFISCSKQVSDIPEVTIDKTKVMQWDFKTLDSWLLGNQDEDYPQGKPRHLPSSSMLRTKGNITSLVPTPRLCTTSSTTPAMLENG